MWSTLRPYEIKSQIEVDVTLTLSTNNILKMMKCLNTIGDDDEIITDIY